MAQGSQQKHFTLILVFLIILFVCHFVCTQQLKTLIY